VELSLLAGTSKRQLAGRPNVISPPPSAPRSCYCRWPKDPAGRSLPQLADRCRSAPRGRGSSPLQLPGRNRHPDEDRGCRGGPRRPHRAPRDDNDDDCRDGTTRTRTTEMEWAADHKIGWRARSGRVGYLPYHNSGNGRSRQRRRKQRQRRGQTTINQKAAEIGAETAATAAAVAAAAAAATTAPTAAEAASEVDGHLTQ
jgi:hypothetical protein